MDDLLRRERWLSRSRVQRTHNACNGHPMVDPSLPILGIGCENPGLPHRLQLRERIGSSFHALQAHEIESRPKLWLSPCRLALANYTLPRRCFLQRRLKRFAARRTLDDPVDVGRWNVHFVAAVLARCLLHRQVGRLYEMRWRGLFSLHPMQRLRVRHKFPRMPDSGHDRRLGQDTRGRGTHSLSSILLARSLSSGTS